MLFEGEGVEVCKGACAIVSQLQQVHRSLRQDPGKVKVLYPAVRCAWSYLDLYYFVVYRMLKNIPSM